MKYLVGMLLVLFASVSFGAENLSTKDDAEALAQSVMVDVGADKLQEGIARLRPYTVIPLAEFDGMVSKLDLQIPVMSQRFGKSLGYDFIDAEELGSSLVQYAYLQKFEKHAMVWRFIFYKPQDKWLLNTWYFDDKVPALFKY